MNGENEGFDYSTEDFDNKARELDDLYGGGAIDVDLDSETEAAINELNALKDEYSKEDAATLLDLCGSVVIQTVTTQFGLLSVLTGDEGRKNPAGKAESVRPDAKAQQYAYSRVSSPMAQKYMKDLNALFGGAQGAAVMASGTAIGIVLRDLIQGIIVEVRVTFDKRGTESFGDILRRFKKRLGIILEEVKEKWHDICADSLWRGISALLSSVVVFVLNIFFTTVRKVAAMIRAGFKSLCQAVRYLVDPPAGMTKEDARFEAAKVLITGMITAASFALSAAIEKWLQTIPGLLPFMQLHIPFVNGLTVGDAIANTISMLAGGLISTVVLYCMDKCRGEALRDRLQIRMIAQSGVVVRCQIAQTWVCLSKGYEFLRQSIEDEARALQEARNSLQESYAAVEAANNRREDAMNMLRARFRAR